MQSLPNHGKPVTSRSNRRLRLLGSGALIESHLPAPSNPREVDVDWSAVQASLGTDLPDDYKTFVGRYGTGAICDFLYVLTPAAASPHLNLLVRGAVVLHALREYRSDSARIGVSVPYSAFPSLGGLLPWGITDNGDTCFWRTGDADPNRWTVVVNDGRGSMWDRFGGTMSEFLEALLTRGYVSEILTDDEFPPKTKSFRPA